MAAKYKTNARNLHPIKHYSFWSEAGNVKICTSLIMIYYCLLLARRHIWLALNLKKRPLILAIIYAVWDQDSSWRQKAAIWKNGNLFQNIYYWHHFHWSEVIAALMFFSIFASHKLALIRNQPNNFFCTTFE